MAVVVQYTGEPYNARAHGLGFTCHWVEVVAKILPYDKDTIMQGLGKGSTVFHEGDKGSSDVLRGVPNGRKP